MPPVCLSPAGAEAAAFSENYSRNVQEIAKNFAHSTQLATPVKEQ